MLIGSGARMSARGDRLAWLGMHDLRTSSAANVGADKDSDRRQREAIEVFLMSAFEGKADIEGCAALTSSVANDPFAT